MGYMDLAERMTLKEYNFKQTLDKQKDIVRLWPQFKSRVSQVKAHGGVNLIKKEQDTWTFRVESGDKKRHAKGIYYLVTIFFDKVDQSIEEAAKHRDSWTTNGQHLNLNKLGAFVINHADLAMSCSTSDGSFDGREPSSQFFGLNTIKTGRGQEYQHDENRPANIRNPGNRGVICKHTQAVFDQLPFYAGTMATELKKFYSKFILDLEKKLLKKQFKGVDKPTVQKPEVQPEDNVKNNTKTQPKDAKQEPPKKQTIAQQQDTEDWEKGNTPEEEEQE